MKVPHSFKMLLLLVFLMASCEPAALPTTLIVTDRSLSISEAAPSVTVTESNVRFQTTNIDLTITRPAEWETFSTEFGVVIAEKFGSVATGGVLEGLMAYTFVTPLSDFSMNISTSNLTQEIFTQIISDPQYMMDAVVSNAYGFDWNGHDAAYYLLNDGDGNVTMVLGVALPDSGILLTSSISAPVTNSQRIRESLPELLRELHINGAVFDGDILAQLPDPLQFPEIESK